MALDDAPNQVEGRSDHKSRIHSPDESLSSLITPKPGVPSLRSPEETSKKSTSWNKILLDTWLPEIFILVLSVACLVTIIVILSVYDGTLSRELPYGITLNAIVSVLATASRSALLFPVAACVGQLKWCWYAKKRPLHDIQTFDDASRGPWGALMFLSGRRAQSAATVGAIVTVLALAFDPFLQQVLSYPTKMRSSENSRAIATKVSAWYFNTEDDLMYRAINAGIWANNSDFTVTPTCDTGNCNWERRIQSIGWCSKCENATSYAKITDCDFENMSVNMNPFYYRGKALKDNDEVMTCSATLSGGNAVRMAEFPGSIDGVPPGYYTLRPSYIWTLNNDSSAPPGESRWSNTTFLGVENPVLAIGSLSLDLFAESRGHDHDQAPYSPRAGSTEECVLSLCEIEYSLSVTNGTSVMDNVTFDWGHTVRYSDGRSCWQPKPGSIRYRQAEVSHLSQGLNNGSFIFHNTSMMSFCPDDLASGRWNSIGAAIASTQRIVTSNSLSSAVRGIAASLTELGLRGDEGVFTHAVEGTAYESGTFVHVAWMWIALPVALEIATVSLLVATMWQTRVQKIRMWKSSVLPLLYHHLAEDLLEQEEVPEKVSDMEVAARSTSVELVHL
ncbi:unnamed protein product [Zymoseptoria tritici ST99CH_3D7]|uniref:Uncharacterized protein n=2 Tax=Zymoseptoria tritici TaxID=1047171 RepID=A0A1X7RW33_ZYMT9|nr:unnamed protein product [Zymoseptoria tritici ST99CH_3D7]